MPAKGWHLPFTSRRIKSWAAAAVDLQYPVKGIQHRDQALCAQNRPSDSQKVSRDFMSPVLTSPHTWKSTEIFHGDVCSSRPAVTFCKNMCLVACPPPSPKSCMHWPSPLPLQSAFSKQCEAVVLILPQIKLNSQLSHCGVFFFFFLSQLVIQPEGCKARLLNRVLLILQFLILPKWLAVWARSILAMFSRKVKKVSGPGWETHLPGKEHGH